jgi:ubiquinone biosynthesis accessory factor UbiK
MIAFLAETPSFGAGPTGFGDRAMDDKKSTRFSLDELARQLAESVPHNLKVLGQDLERNFKTLLQSGIERMELVSREEFDLQRAVLDRTRAKLETMEARLEDLEKALSSRPK